MFKEDKSVHKGAQRWKIRQKGGVELSLSVTNKTLFKYLWIHFGKIQLTYAHVSKTLPPSRPQATAVSLFDNPQRQTREYFFDAHMAKLHKQNDYSYIGQTNETLRIRM